MARLIKTWEELNGIESEKYKVVVDLDMCSGYIEPKEETEETEENYYDHHVYLSTHTFYGSQYKYSTSILQQFGFDVEIDNWDKENPRMSNIEKERYLGKWGKEG